MTEKLKPCPFCGSKSVRLESVSLGGMANVTCNDCGVEGPCRYTDAEAITAWNTRPQSDLTREGVARVIDPKAMLTVPEEFERVRAGGGWQPIESAPRDGTLVDLWVVVPPKSFSSTGSGRVADAWFSAGKWWVYNEHGDHQCRAEVHNATHWMPLPSAPKEGDQ